MAAQQPAAQTGRLCGEAPDIFHGDRSKSETFKQQFKVYQGINDNHEVMQNPYYRCEELTTYETREVVAVPNSRSRGGV
jgi:hypothetical protein